LEELGVEVITAENGITGLNTARKSDPGLIITDTTLPYMNGYHVSRMLKNDDRYKNIPIVFVSTDDDNDSILESKRAGGDLFLRKPIQTPILINELIALLTGANNVQAN
jgi:CheY-like chemotaxis protein